MIEKQMFVCIWEGEGLVAGGILGKHNFNSKYEKRRRNRKDEPLQDFVLVMAPMAP